jgi:REP element-mobilizing transposase RayT
MALDRDAYHRRSIRLPTHNYASPGAYFITIVTRDRECLFGDVTNGAVVLNPAGDVVAREWQRSAEVRKEISLDSFVVMPNHLHAIVHLRAVGAHGRAPLRTPRRDDVPFRPPRSLGALVAGFKSSATKAVNILRDTPGVPVWQRNYFERTIRNQAELARIRQYIRDNPANWHADPENPSVAASVAHTSVEGGSRAATTDGTSLTHNKAARLATGRPSSADR